MFDRKIITIMDEIIFTKKLRALKKYFPLTYKYLIFDFFPKLKQNDKKNGIYSVELPTDNNFDKIYGSLIINFTIVEDKINIEDILPSEILLDMYNHPLPVYKGIPFRNEKDYFKLRLLCDL